jgi:ketosteroid isomerase-like protein
MESDLEQISEADHRAGDAFVQGDPDPKKQLYSRRDDVTLANPLGPPARGWSQVSEALERAAALLRDGEPVTYERISGYATEDLAYTLEFERSRMKVGGSKEMSPVSLRVTTVFRREDTQWRIVHRHADPITVARSPESIVQSADS